MLRAPRADRIAGAAALAIGASLVAFGVWSYLIPPVDVTAVGLDPPAGGQFRALLHLGWRLPSEQVFRQGLAVILGIAAAAYLALLGALDAGGRLSPRWTGAGAGALALAFAALVPPALSPDVYAYVGYARLAVVHHLNPYLATQNELVRLGDPTAPFLKWGIASPYGPLWTLVSLAVTAPLAGAALGVQVVAMKLVAAGGLLALAAAGRALAERIAPGRGPTAFAALALNPFFFIEGPGNGHNDLVMAAGALFALVAAADRRWWRAFLLVGCAGAIKFVPLLLGPWLVVRAARARGASTPRTIAFLAGSGAVVLAPLVASYLPFWRGLATFGGLQQRWIDRGGAHGAVATAGAALGLAALTAGAALWSARDLGRLVFAWVVASAAALVLFAGAWFPWYWIWPWGAALVLWDRRGRTASILLYCLVVGLSLRYAWATPS
ncbi:MAG TPA: hypothetical protein VHO06_21570 [Polyangia bacterium]|nr:hypothetical protein [Polyangia bacterium]